MEALVPAASRLDRYTLKRFGELNLPRPLLPTWMAVVDRVTVDRERWLGGIIEWLAAEIGSFLKEIPHFWIVDQTAIALHSAFMDRYDTTRLQLQLARHLLTQHRQTWMGC